MAKTKQVRVTYSITTEESAAEGDHADHGYIDVPTGEQISLSGIVGDKARRVANKARGQKVRTVEEAAEFIASEAGWGTIEPSSTAFHHGIWYSSMRSEGYDGSEEWSFHPEGFSLSEERQLFDLLNPRRR